jgi:hypothetical protein
MRIRVSRTVGRPLVEVYDDEGNAVFASIIVHAIQQSGPDGLLVDISIQPAIDLTGDDLGTADLPAAGEEG